jgi:hypothetical protein
MAVHRATKRGMTDIAGLSLVVRYCNRKGFAKGAEVV